MTLFLIDFSISKMCKNACLLPGTKVGNLYIILNISRGVSIKGIQERFKL